MNGEFYNIGIEDNLNRARVRTLLTFGVIGSLLTGTTFLSVGNLLVFGGLLATLPSEERFAEFRQQLAEKK